LNRLFALTLGVLIAAPAAAMAQDLPPGPGADVVQRACQTCHGLDQVTSVHNSADGWRGVVNEMINNGAVVSDDDAAQIVTYLSTNFGVSGAAAPAAAAPAAAAPAAAAPAAAAPAAAAPMDAAPAPASAPPANPMP
jgi:hypothetical protein